MQQRGDTLAAEVAVLKQRMDALTEVVSGGPGLDYDDSIRGRLHALMQRAATEDKLAEAAKEMRRATAETRRQTNWRLGVVVAVLGILPPWVLLIANYIH